MADPESDERLRRLLALAQEDPDNPQLLADAWEAAMAAGEHDTASALAEQGAGRDEAGLPAWLRRRAHAALAAGRHEAAARLLAHAQQAGLPREVAGHDLACVAFSQGDFARCAALLAPGLDDTADASFRDASQALWLRAMHRLGNVDVAWSWVLEHERAGRPLQADAAGAASLLAIDADAFEQALALADRALAREPLGVEALTARGCVALAQADTKLSHAMLERAEAVQPRDGRIQSALGLLALHESRFGDAQVRFAAAVAAWPRHIGSWHGLGWSRLLQGDVASARAPFEQALSIDTGFGESHGALGLVLVLEGRQDEAQDHLRRAHKLDPRNVTASFADALASGRVSPAQFGPLARRLLDRPGFFGEKLSARWDSHPREAGSP